MLPDYPKFKTLLGEILIERMKKVMLASQGFMGEVPRLRIFEGDTLSTIREDGTKEASKPETIGEEISWSFDEIENLEVNDVIKKIDEIAINMARKQSEFAFKEITEAVRKVGNEVDVKGEPLQPKHFFEMIRKIQMQFDVSGNPIYPSIVAGTKAFDAFRKMFDQLEEDPTLKKEYEELIERKRKEWHDRETSRTLVG